MCVCSFQTLNSLCDSATELTSVERSNSSGAGKACRVTIPADDKAHETVSACSVWWLSSAKRQKLQIICI